MPRRKRTAKAKRVELTETQRWVLGDRRLYQRPETINRWEEFQADFITNNWESGKTFWVSVEAMILEDWVSAFPGSRPALWWSYSAPRMSQADIERNGWGEWYFAREQHLPDPRRRTGGTGEALYETSAYTPSFEYGVPDGWDLATLDPDDMPHFESQAAYLMRHGLFMPGEKRRLRKQDFEDETLDFSEISQRDAGDDFCGTGAAGVDPANDIPAGCR